jgi:hypothetical protein
LDIDFQSRELVRTFTVWLHRINYPDLPEVLHSFPVLPFFEHYFDWLTSIDNGDISSVQKDFREGCKALSLLLIKRCYTPSEICEGTQILDFLEPQLESNLPDVEDGVATFYSVCLCREDVPDLIVNAFLPIALHFRTAFQSEKARRSSLHFFIRFFQYASQISDEVYDRVNECLYDTLTNADTHLFYTDAIHVLRTELLFHQESWRSCEPLIPVAMLLLKTHDDQLLRAVWKFFSVVLITPAFPAEALAGDIPYESIILNVDSVVPKMAGQALSLLIDFSMRGAVFIDGLIAAGLYEVIGMNFDRKLKCKQKVYRLCTNILSAGAVEHVVALIAKPFFKTMLEESDAFGRANLAGFLKALLTVAQVATSAGCADGLRNVFTENELWEPIAELQKSEYEEVAVIAGALMDGRGLD